MSLEKLAIPELRPLQHVKINSHKSHYQNPRSNSVRVLHFCIKYASYLLQIKSPPRKSFCFKGPLIKIRLRDLSPIHQILYKRSGQVKATQVSSLKTMRSECQSVILLLKQFPFTARNNKLISHCAPLRF